MRRSRGARVVAALTLVVVSAMAAPAAAFPDKPLELTVLFGAGSAADLLARKLAELGRQGSGPAGGRRQPHGRRRRHRLHLREGPEPGRLRARLELQQHQHRLSRGQHEARLHGVRRRGRADQRAGLARRQGRRALEGHPRASRPRQSEPRPGPHRQLRPRQLHPPDGGGAARTAPGSKLDPRAVRPRAGGHHRARGQDRGERAAAGRDHDPGDGPAGPRAGDHRRQAAGAACPTSRRSRRAASISPWRSGAGSRCRRARRRR